jgi:hypothetical protein
VPPLFRSPGRAPGKRAHQEPRRNGDIGIERLERFHTRDGPYFERQCDGHDVENHHLLQHERIEHVEQHENGGHRQERPAEPGRQRPPPAKSTAHQTTPTPTERRPEASGRFFFRVVTTIALQIDQVIERRR